MLSEKLPETGPDAIQAEICACGEVQEPGQVRGNTDDEGVSGFYKPSSLAEAHARGKATKA